MNRWARWCLAAAAVAWLGWGARAQDDVARRAADREAAEERYRHLSSAIETLEAAQTDLRRRLDQVGESLQRVSAEARSRPGDDRFVTREEFKKLVDTVAEIDRKREADKRQILAEIENLGKTLGDRLREAARRSASAEPARPGARVEPKPEPKPAGGAATPLMQEGVGVEYVIEKGNTLSAIIAAHNERYKAEGRRTSLKLVLEANPKLKPNALQPGTKIFIPLVKMESP